MAKKKQQARVAKKATKAQPQKSKTTGKSAPKKQVKAAKPAAKKAAQKKVSPPPVAGTAFMAAVPGGMPIGLDRATQIVQACAMGQDLGSTIGDLPDPGAFAVCIGSKTSGCNCPVIPLSNETKLLDVVAAVAQCICG